MYDHTRLSKVEERGRWLRDSAIAVVKLELSRNSLVDRISAVAGDLLEQNSCSVLVPSTGSLVISVPSLQIEPLL